METCEVCDFAWDAVSAAEIPTRLSTTSVGFRDVLTAPAELLATRPEPTVWSVLEYCGHVRDALFNLRDRIICGLAEDNPVPKPMFQAARIEHGIYVADKPETMAVELDVATNLLAKTIVALDDDLLSRPIFYPWPRGATRNLLWVAAQALHEAEHHLTDVRAAVG